MAGTTTTSTLLGSVYRSHLGMPPKNLATPASGAALSARSVPSVRFLIKGSFEPLTARPFSSTTVVSVETSSAPRRQASIWPMLLPWFDSPPRNITVLPLYRTAEAWKGWRPVASMRSASIATTTFWIGPAGQGPWKVMTRPS